MGADDVARESGTGDAIPRYQRFVRPPVNHLSFAFLAATLILAH
jgi:hypothetical protein